MRTFLRFAASAGLIAVILGTLVVLTAPVDRDAQRQDTPVAAAPAPESPAPAESVAKSEDATAADADSAQETVTAPADAESENIDTAEAPAAAPEADAAEEPSEKTAALPSREEPSEKTAASSEGPAASDDDGVDEAAGGLISRTANIDGSALKRFIEFYRKGDVAAGDGARAAITDPAARALLEWVAIRYNGRALGFDRISAFVKAHPGWPSANVIRGRAEEALYDEKRPHAAVRAFFAMQHPTTAAGKLALGRALKAENKDAEAAVLIRDAWRDESLNKSLETAINTGFKDVLRQADHRYRMERLLFKEQWQAALKAAAYAGPDYVALAKARIAVARKAGNAAAALNAVPVAVRSDSSYAFTRTLFLMRADKLDEAVKALEGVSRDPEILVNGDEWWIERRILARKLLDQGNAATAYRIVREHGADRDAMKIEAEFHAGWIALRYLGETAAAAGHFAAAAKFAETPISVARVAYWQGRAAEDAEDADGARQHYERAAAQTTTYYGQLARIKLDLRDLPLREAPQGGRAALEEREAVQAIPLLHEAGVRDLVLAIYVGLAQTLTDARELDALADIAAGYKDARAMVLIGKAATQRGYPLDVAAFPTIGIPTYEPVGEPVEKPMVYAIARQESVFDPKAQSGAGARGLMQLMPATAKETAKRAGLDYKAEMLTGDPAYNAKIGATHLRDLIKHWRGSYILTFAAYNAGSGNVKKWITAYGDPRRDTVDPVDWVERIPYTETRNYVQRVMENLQVYRRRLGERTAVLIDGDLRRGAPVR